MLDIKEDPTGVCLHVRVSPRAARDEVVGIHQGALQVRLKAPPVDDKANKALMYFLSAALKLPKSSVHLVAGRRSRDKRVRLDGVTGSEVMKLILCMMEREAK